MQVFEFHFNPPKQSKLAMGQAKLSDLIFDSFCYEPENVYEKRLGSLFMVGELKNVLPQNLKFLDNLAIFLKGKYYSTPIKLSPETSLKESLKKSNEFLERIAKSGDVSWLGNLNLVVLNLASQQKNWLVNFTKVGTPKILLLRENQIIDIGKNLEFSEIEPYPLKIFGNIVAGKLAEDDLILILTREVFNFFSAQNLLSEIAKIVPFNEKKLREIFKREEALLSKISGICLLIFLSREILPKKRQMVVGQPKLFKFSLSQLFRPVSQASKKLILKLMNFFASFRLRLGKQQLQPTKFLNTLQGVRQSTESLRLKIIKLFAEGKEIKSLLLNKNVILVICLIFFLLLGFVIFQKEKAEELKKYESLLNEIQTKVFEAENLLIFKNEKGAQALFKETWEEILPLTKIDSTLSVALSEQIFSLKQKIEENLGELNKLEIIEEPEILFEFNAREFIPQKMVILEGRQDGCSLYFFNPYSQNIFKVNSQGEGILIEEDKKIHLAVRTEDSILFFSKPNLLLPFENNQFQEYFILETPYPDPSFSQFSFFKSSLYFLDSQKGEIAKYPNLKNFQWELTQIWLNSAAKKAIGAKGMAVDGSIWILDKNNSIERYYAGNFQETIKLDFFPYPKDFSKIFASANFLYLLEPEQSRLVILNKSGQIVKQFQSKNFDNLKDFAVSEDEKTIWLLNGLKVYKILNSIF